MSAISRACRLFFTAPVQGRHRANAQTLRARTSGSGVQVLSGPIVLPPRQRQLSDASHVYPPGTQFLASNATVGRLKAAVRPLNQRGGRLTPIV